MTSSIAPASSSTCRGYAGRPRPVQRPHPPIMIGGGGQARADSGRPGSRHRQHLQRSRSSRATTTGLTHTQEARRRTATCARRRRTASRTSTSRARRTSPRSPTIRGARSPNLAVEDRHLGRRPARPSQRADRLGRRRRRRPPVASRRTGRQLRDRPAVAGRRLRAHCGQAARPVTLTERSPKQERDATWPSERDSASTRTATPTTSSNSPTTASCSCSATPTATAWCGAGRRTTTCPTRSPTSPATARSRC